MIFKCGIEVPSEIKCLLFDLDGTLVDNMHLHKEAWVKTGEKFNLPITGEMVEVNAGIPTRQLIQKLSIENDWEVDFQLFTIDKQARYKEVKKSSGKIITIDPIIDIAKHYKNSLPMGIGTGSSRSNAISALEEANIIDWFGVVVTADDVKKPKPHPEVYAKGAKVLKVDPSDCLVFEDGDKGIESAIQAGMQWVDVRKYL